MIGSLLDSPLSYFSTWAYLLYSHKLPGSLQVVVQEGYRRLIDPKEGSASVGAVYSWWLSTSQP